MRNLLSLADEWAGRGTRRHPLIWLAAACLLSLATAATARADTPPSLFDEGEDVTGPSNSPAQPEPLTNVALGKPATQSSSYADVPASPAVDGNLESGSHTDYETGAWWQVDLGASFEIHEVHLYNRTDCCQGRLSNLDVSLSTDGITAASSISIPGVVGRPTTVSFEGQVGRYVRIRLRGTDYLTLAEVQVMGRPTPERRGLTNVALGKPAAQSSSYAEVPASPAVDGNLSTGNHTDYEAGAWWQVDLGAPYEIHQVFLYNRVDCCQDRLANLDVSLSTDGATWASIYIPGTVGRPTTVTFDARVGRYLRVRLRGTDYLTLAEVIVMGRPAPAVAGLTNVALGRPTAQSSSYAGVTGDPAVDGNEDTNPSHTEYQAQAWWQVDLGGPFEVHEVRLFNRTDCCRERLFNLDVSLSADGVAWTSIYVPGYVGRPTSVDFGGSLGRHLRVQLRGTNYLSLVEVKVMGRTPPTELPLTSPEVVALVDAQLTRDGAAVEDYRVVRLAAGVAEDSPVLRVTLLDGETVTLVMDRFERLENRTVWMGHVEGKAASHALLMWKGGSLWGILEWPGDSYAIRQAGGYGVHILEKIDPSAHEQCGTVAAESGATSATTEASANAAPSAAPAQASASDGGGGTSVLDILAVYTPQAAAAAGGAEALRGAVEGALAYGNSAFSRSMVGAHMHLLGFLPVNHPDVQLAENQLDALMNGGGEMARVRAFRDMIGADFVALIVDTLDVGGRAGTVGVDSEKAFVVMRRDALGGRTFVHEVAHAMGSAHDRDNAGGFLGIGQGAEYSFSYGHRVPGLFRTIMAYDCGRNCDGCQECPEVAYFSTPLIYHESGFTYGHGTADNARSLNLTRGAAAGYRHRPPAPPAPLLQEPVGQIRTYRPDFVWQGSSLAVSYVLSVYRVPASGGEPLLWQTGQLSHEFCVDLTCRLEDVTNLTTGNYFWTVEAKNLLGYGTISDPLYFEVVTCPRLGGSCFWGTPFCPPDFSHIGPAPECDLCCKPAPLPETVPTCAEMGGDYCNDDGFCLYPWDLWVGYTTNCAACCRSQPQPTCMAMGGNGCGENGACPANYASIGYSSDCGSSPCCQYLGLSSCLGLGGDTCGWDGPDWCPPDYTNRGVSWDCYPNACCRWNVY